jgi:hypothetical protein
VASLGPKRPNILLIVSDDQAWTDHGFMGHPTIVRSVSRELTFHRACVAPASPRSSPADTRTSTASSATILPDQQACPQRTSTGATPTGPVANDCRRSSSKPPPCPECFATRVT